MNISIGNDIRVSHMNSMTSLRSNTDNSSMNSLNKQKNALQNKIKELSEKKGLSSSEKTQKLNELQKQMDELDTQIGKQKLEEIKNGGKELIAENMAKKEEKCTTNEERKEIASATLNYSLISASTDYNDVKKLNGYRTIAIREDGPDSDKVKRIDNMISGKQKNIKENLANMAKAIGEYLKNSRNKPEQKNDKYNNIANQKITKKDSNNALSTSEKTGDSGIINQEINTDVRVNTALTSDNINEIIINDSGKSESLEGQVKSKNVLTQHSIDTHV